MVECELKYPQDLHDDHNDYPLEPENVEIDKVRKLVPHLGKRTKYILHYRNLKMSMEKGIKLAKVHRIIELRQSHGLSRTLTNTPSLEPWPSLTPRKIFLSL